MRIGLEWEDGIPGWLRTGFCEELNLGDNFVRAADRCCRRGHHHAIHAGGKSRFKDPQSSAASRFYWRIANRLRFWNNRLLSSEK